MSFRFLSGNAIDFFSVCWLVVGGKGNERGGKMYCHVFPWHGSFSNYFGIIVFELETFTKCIHGETIGRDGTEERQTLVLCP